MHWETQFRHLATRQAGTVGIGQLAVVGCDANHWWQARRSGRWELVTRRVLRLLGAPRSDEQRVHAALLDAGGGAVLHGESTLAWVGLRQFGLSRVHAVRRRETTSDKPELAVLHRLRDLTDEDVITVRGVPTVRAIRAIWSVASTYSARRDFDYGFRKVGRILDDANVAGAVTWEELHESVDRLGRSGRAGTTLMRALCAKRPIGSSPTESGNEDRFEEVVGPRRMTLLRRQRPVGAERPIGRVDYRGDDLPLVIEVNSKAYHSTPSDQSADESRYQALKAAGFVVGVAWDDDLWREPAAVIEMVDMAFRHARRSDPVELHTPSCPWPFDPSRTLVGRPHRRARG